MTNPPEGIQAPSGREQEREQPKKGFGRYGFGAVEEIAKPNRDDAECDSDRQGKPDGRRVKSQAISDCGESVVQVFQTWSDRKRQSAGVDRVFAHDPSDRLHLGGR